MSVFGSREICRADHNGAGRGYRWPVSSRAVRGMIITASDASADLAPASQMNGK